MQPKLVWCGGFILLGVWSIGWWAPLLWTVLWGAGLASCLAVLASNSRLGDISLLVAAFCLGCALGVRPQPAQCRPDSIRGKVEVTSGRRALVNSSCGRWELTFPVTAPHRGTNIVARAQLQEPKAQLPGEPSEVFRMRRLRATPARVIQWTQLSSKTSVDMPLRYSQRVHGGLLWAFASGHREHINKDVTVLLRKTGTSHLLAISGMHIGLVAGMVYGGVRFLLWPIIWRGWYWAGLVLPRVAACCVAAMYGGLVGWPASAQRAVLMILLVSTSSFLGRRLAIGPMLMLIALIIVFNEPAELNQLGFQLSFSAIVGMALIVPRVTRLFPPDTPTVWVRVGQSLGATLGATLGTLPITAWYFQQVSPVSPIANLLATPVFAMVAVPCALLGFVLPDSVSPWALILGDFAIEIGLVILQQLSTDLWYPAVGGVGALMLCLIFFLHRREVLMLIAIGLILRGCQRQVSGLEVSFLNVGQGDASVLAWPDGQHWLIDGGPSRHSVLRYLRRERISVLNVLVVSHAHQDHIAGVLGLEAFPIQEIWIPKWPKDIQSVWGQWLLKKSAQGTRIVLPDQIKHESVRVLHPVDGWSSNGRQAENEESLVLEIEHMGWRILWTGDIESEGEHAILNRLQSVDVLKVAHHGGRRSSGMSFLNRTNPDYAVISSGKGNRFQHPHIETLWRLRESRILRTDQFETIRMQFSEEKISITGHTASSGFRLAVTNQETRINRLE